LPGEIKIMTETFFICGISTEVGKTVTAAIVTQALEADYWKPVQAGELEDSDTDKVRRWVRNSVSVFHDTTYRLKTPMSPHAAAELEGVRLKSEAIVRPNSKNTLVIEGAGGLLVPLNLKETMIDLIRPTDKVILVSRHYLGSINHTLLSIEALRQRKLNLFGIIFNGASVDSTEKSIATLGKVNILGRIDDEPYIDHHVVGEYAEKFAAKLKTDRI
jgi:dethiobiotin synthetase